jgi:hypothetical protein
MRIQINSDKNIAADMEFRRSTRAEINRVVERFKDKLTRIEVHLSDVNSWKSGKQDKRCVLEARPAGRQPIAVTASAGTVDYALRSSLAKLRNKLNSSFARVDRIRRRVPPAKKAALPGLPASKTRIRGGKRAEAGAVSEKKSGLPVKKSARRATSKRSTARKAESEEAAVNGRGPKKKHIYQARRKGWPRR